MVNLAYNDLFHKKGKFMLILIGLSFSMFFVLYSAAMYNGILTQASTVIDRYDFNAWIKEEDKENFIDGGLINDTIFWKIQDMAKVDEAERLIVAGMDIYDEKRTMYCIVLGYDKFNPEHDITPWDVIEGYKDDLALPNSIIVDIAIKDYFKVDIDDKLMIGNLEMRIVGFCENAKFLFNPFVWASIETARNIAPWIANWSSMIAVDLDDGYTVEEFKDKIEDDIGHRVEVYSTEEFRQNTYDEIVYEGGMGGSIGILVGMGFFVALIILTVTMYQSIQEKIPVFGTLKAIGASKGFINKMLFGQVFVYITLSFVLSIILTILFGASGLTGAFPIILNVPTTIILYFIFLGLGFVCSLFSIMKVHKIDPAIVFK